MNTVIVSCILLGIGMLIVFLISDIVGKNKQIRDQRGRIDNLKAYKQQYENIAAVVEGYRGKVPNSEHYGIPTIVRSLGYYMDLSDEKLKCALEDKRKTIEGKHKAIEGYKKTLDIYKEAVKELQDKPGNDYSKFLGELETLLQNVNDTTNARQDIPFEYKLASLRAVRRVREFINEKRKFNEPNPT